MISLAEHEALIRQGPAVIMMSREDAITLIASCRAEGREEAAQKADLAARTAMRNHTNMIGLGYGYDTAARLLSELAQEIRRG